MKKIKFIFLAILLGAVVTIGYFISLDNQYKVSRTKLIKAPSNIVLQQIADLQNWNKWAPWKEKDSTMVFEFNESTKNEGDFFRFTDTNGMRQKLTNLTINDTLIKQSLTSKSKTQEMIWNIVQKENATEVTWTVKGEVPLLERIYTKQMDVMMGPMLTRGLELLEKSTKLDMEKHSSKIDKVTELGSVYYLYQSASCKLTDLGKKMDEILPIVLMYTINNKIEMNGKIFTIYNKWDKENGSVIFSSCIPTKEKITAEGDILTGKTDGGKYLRVIYQGDYKFLREAWDKAYKEIANKENLLIDTTRNPFEVYVTGHTKSLNPADWITEIYIPVIELMPEKALVQ